ncbi:MAG: exo-alpha-sialidase [Chloroflexi bacterium]|nr:exo-alpha-sialidase [Chloroflexota bacterium]
MWYAAREPDGTWTGSNDVVYTGEGGYTVRNALAVTSDGILHAVFRAGTSHLSASAPARAAQQANLWRPPVHLNNNGYYLDLTKDRNDILHFVYSGGVGALNRGEKVAQAESSACALCNDLFYRRSTDGGQSWSAEIPLSFEPDSGSDRMDIFEGSSGRLYVVWDEGNDWYKGSGSPRDVRVVYSDDAGLTWSDPIILDGEGRPDLHPIQIAAAEMLDGSLIAVWRYASDADRNIYYQISDDLGQSWTKPEAVPGIVARAINDTPLDDYELLVDRQGTVSLFAAGQPSLGRNTNAALYQVQYREGLWLPPQRIFYSPEARPEWPKVALGPQNDIHLTFFTRGIREGQTEYTSATANLKVYYTYLPGIFPARVVAFRPTPTPLPTATPIQNFEPTATPFVLQAPIDRPVVPTTTDVYAAQTLLGGMFAAGLACAAVLVIYRFIRRQ